MSEGFPFSMRPCPFCGAWPEYKNKRCMDSFKCGTTVVAGTDKPVRRGERCIRSERMKAELLDLRRELEAEEAKIQPPGEVPNEP